VILILPCSNPHTHRNHWFVIIVHNPEAAVKKSGDNDDSDDESEDDSGSDQSTNSHSNTVESEDETDTVINRT